MNKQEFINTLRRELAGIDDYDYINDTASYYENYIESEIRKGSTEEEVLAQLGDARLIAKSIRASRSESADYEEERTVGEDSVRMPQSIGSTLIRKFLNLPSWARNLTGGVLVVGALALTGALISWLFPVILVGGIAYAFYRFLRDNFMR